MPTRGARPATGFTSLIRPIPDRKLASFLESLPVETLRGVEYGWGNWVQKGQEPPKGEWRTWVMMTGRGFGKTRAGAEWIKEAVKSGARLEIALVGATFDDARRVMVEGKSGLLRIAKPFIERWHRGGPTLYFAGGSRATLFSGANPEGLRGPEHHIAWCDELAKWERPQETWDNLQLGMRLGERPRVLVTTTPRSGHALLARIEAAKGTVKTGGHTRANLHLPPAFIEAVTEMYEGTRLGRQELDGELLTDAPGALWSVELLERCRIDPPRTCLGEVAAAQPLTEGQSSPPPSSTVPLPEQARGGFERTLIGVDPPSGAGTCGIVACAIDAGGHLHILADHSVTALGPDGWARCVADAAAAHGAHAIVAETNQGGAMVEETLKAVDHRLRVKPVTATIGKAARAGPVSARFRAGKAWLHGRMPQLEGQLCGLIEGGGYDGPGRSPDRADAMVWACTELLAWAGRAAPRVRVL